MNTSHRRIGFALAVASTLVLGCKGGATPIGTLLDNPAGYDHKIVRIQGTVGEAAGILGYGGYRLDDGTGKILVITQSNGAPRTGAKVGVEGEFRSGFTLGTQSLAVVMEQKRAGK